MINIFKYKLCSITLVILLLSMTFFNTYYIKSNALEELNITIEKGITDKKAVVNDIYARGNTWQAWYLGNNTFAIEFGLELWIYDEKTKAYKYEKPKDKSIEPSGNISIFAIELYADITISTPFWDRVVYDDVATGKTWRPLAETSLFLGDFWGDASCCARSGVEWNISAIDDGASISDTDFRYEGLVNLGVFTSNIYEISARPSAATAGNFWTDAGDGVLFVNSDPFPVVGNNQEIDLGANADIDLEAQLGVDWFAIGIMINPEDGGVNIRGSIASENEGTPTPKPTLYVEYTLLNLVYLTTVYFVGIASITVNATITANNTETAFNKTETANITATISNNYNFFFFYELVNFTHLHFNPYYLYMDSNITVYTYAIPDVSGNGGVTVIPNNQDYRGYIFLGIILSSIIAIGIGYAFSKKSE